MITLVIAIRNEDFFIGINLKGTIIEYNRKILAYRVFSCQKESIIL